jgi:hypothetical protein
MTTQTGTRTLQILTLAACGMACLLALLPAAGHDQMWLLYAARLHLAGAPLYGPQIFETNPPMGIWLSALPELLARILPLPDTAVGKLLVILAGFAAAAWALRLIRPLFAALERTALWWLAFTGVSLFAVMPARDFGQRDHLMALLALPYLATTARSANASPVPVWQTLTAGFIAALGVCLKPHQALAIVAVELLLLLFWLKDRRRPHRAAALPLLRPELLAILASGAAFLLAIRLRAPLYFSEVLPIARDTYWAFHQLTFLQVLAESAQLHVLLLADIALIATLRWRIPRLTSLLLAAGLGSTFAYYLQGTGWYYQQLPALTFFGLALAFLLLQLVRPPSTLGCPTRAPLWRVGNRLDTEPSGAPSEVRSGGFIPASAAGLGALALVLTAHFTDYPFTPARSFPIDTPDPSFFTDLPPGTPVATLTTTVDFTVPPVFRYHLTLAQRYPHLWMLPAILRSEDPQNTGFYTVKPSNQPGAPSERGSVGMGRPHRIPPARLAELDALQHRFMAEDLARWQPRLLLVERCQDSTVHCQVLEDRRDNLLAFFLRDPAFRAQFAHYRYWRSAGPFNAWLRADAP